MDNNFNNKNQNVFQPNGFNQMPQQPVNNGQMPQQPFNNGQMPQQPFNNGQFQQNNNMGGFNQMPQQQFNGNRPPQQMKLNQTSGGSGNNNNNGLKIAIVAISILLVAAIIAIIVILTGKDDKDDKDNRKTTQEVVTEEETTEDTEETTEDTEEETTEVTTTEEVTTEEATTEETTTEAAGSNTVDVSGIAFTNSEWTSLEFAVDGKVISWPLTYNDVKELGFSIDSANEEQELESNHYTMSARAENASDNNIYVRFKNFTDETKLAKDCDIMGLSFEVDDCGSEIVLCNGITFGMTYEQVKSIMGEPSYFYESEDSDYKSADYDVSDDAYSNSISFTFSDGTLTEITFENYD